MLSLQPFQQCRTVKMHLLEDHATELAEATKMGFGSTGKQGAKAIHAQFNSLMVTAAFTVYPVMIPFLGMGTDQLAESKVGEPRTGDSVKFEGEDGFQTRWNGSKESCRSIF